eukprot:364422-Chlamydomonas_euryale.AAC.3
MYTSHGMHVLAHRVHLGCVAAGDGQLGREAQAGRGQAHPGPGGAPARLARAAAVARRRNSALLPRQPGGRAAGGRGADVPVRVPDGRPAPGKVAASAWHRARAAAPAARRRRAAAAGGARRRRRGAGDVWAAEPAERAAAHAHARLVGRARHGRRQGAAPAAHLWAHRRWAHARGRVAHARHTVARRADAAAHKGECGKP